MSLWDAPDSESKIFARLADLERRVKELEALKARVEALERVPETYWPQYRTGSDGQIVNGDPRTNGQKHYGPPYGPIEVPMTKLYRKTDE